MRKKKEIPLAILKALEDFVNLKGNKFEIVDPKSHLLKAVDKDEDSSFHFTILEYKKATNSGTFQFFMDRSPRNQNDPGAYQGWVEITNLQAQFTVWIELLDQYENVNSFFDDPILNSFSEEFFSEFEFIEEENAETKPLNTKQILLLDEYLETVNSKIEEFRNDGNFLEIEEIKADISELTENLSNKPKAWVVRKLTRIWAKMAKQGIQFIKEFLTESKKEAIKQGIKIAIDYVKENGHDLLN